MNQQPPTPDPQDDELQRLVREATQVHVDQLSLARLQRYWHAQSTRHRRRPWVVATAAAAAAVLCTVVWRPWPRPETPVAQTPAPRPAAEDPVGVAPAPPAEQTVRAPTALEAVLFYSQVGPTHRTRVAWSPRPDEPSLEQRVTDLLAQGSQRAAVEFTSLPAKAAAYEIVEAHLDDLAVVPFLLHLAEISSEREHAEALLGRLDPSVIDTLFAQLDSQDQRVRRQAALALGRINGPHTTQRLIAMVNSNARRQEAWLALACCGGPQAEAFLSYAAQQPRLLGFLNAARVRWSLP